MFFRRDIQTRALASGDSLTIPVFHFKGKNNTSSPSLYVQSCIHGAEVQGYMVAMLLIEHFIKEPPLGNVTIVPIANPYGVNNKSGEYTLGRFDPVTGDNWNRNYADLTPLIEKFYQNNHKPDIEQLIPLFKKFISDHLKKRLLEKNNSYHNRLALELQMMASNADVVLDLHCDTISKPHVYSAKYAINSAKNLGIEYIIEIPNEFHGALDEAIFCPWIKLIDLHSKNNNVAPPVEAFTMELGSQEYIDKKLAAKQCEHILSYCGKKGICSSELLPPLDKIYSCKLEDFVTIYSPNGGLIIEHADLGKEVLANTPLTSISRVTGINEKIPHAIYDITLPYKSIPITRISTANIHEGMQLMKVFTNSSII